MCVAYECFGLIWFSSVCTCWFPFENGKYLFNWKEIGQEILARDEVKGRRYIYVGTKIGKWIWEDIRTHFTNYTFWLFEFNGSELEVIFASLRKPGTATGLFSVNKWCLYWSFFSDYSTSLEYHFLFIFWNLNFYFIVFFVQFSSYLFIPLFFFLLLLLFPFSQHNCTSCIVFFVISTTSIIIISFYIYFVVIIYWLLFNYFFSVFISYTQNVRTDYLPVLCYVFSIPGWVSLLHYIKKKFKSFLL